MNIPDGWNRTKYPNEWIKDTPFGFCIVRGASSINDALSKVPYVRCYVGRGGVPEDFERPLLEECFNVGEMFLKMLEAGASEMAVVGEVMLFTKLLDGGGPIRCVCGNIWRHVPHDHFGVRACPACGRLPNDGIPCTIEEYKESRKD